MHGSRFRVHVPCIGAICERFREHSQTYFIANLYSYRIKDVYNMFSCVASSLIELLELWSYIFDQVRARLQLRQDMEVSSLDWSRMLMPSPYPALTLLNWDFVINAPISSAVLTGPIPAVERLSALLEVLLLAHYIIDHRFKSCIRLFSLIHLRIHQEL